MPEFLSRDQMLARFNASQRGIAEELQKDRPLLAALIGAGVMIDERGRFEYGVRAANPTVQFRDVNGAITASVSTTDNYIEEMALAEHNPWVDNAAIVGDPLQAVADEALATLDAIEDIFGEGFYYGDRTVNRKSLDGLSTRLLLSSTPDTTGQVVSAGGSGSDLTSIYIVSIGERGLHLFAQSTDTFIKNEFKGDVMHPTNKTWGKGANVWMRCGMVLRTVRAAAQICNIETSGSSNILTEDLLWSAFRRVRNPTHIFASPRGWELFQKVARSAGQIQTGKNDFGQAFFTFGGVPVFMDEMIIETETAKAAS